MNQLLLPMTRPLRSPSRPAQGVRGAALLSVRGVGKPDRAQVPPATGKAKAKGE